jgi:hypothetical protein
MTQFACARHWLSRLYVTMSILISVLITMLEPRSLAYQVMEEGSAAGWAFLFLLGALGLVALFDVCVNDLLPHEFDMPSGRRWRHLVYMALAVGLCCVSFVIAADTGFSMVLLNYWKDIAICVAIAYLDLFQRHRGA